MVAVAAALLGTLLGSLATIGAAIVSGWAQREGARISARSQYIKDRHQPRSDTYKSFMKMAVDLTDRVVENDGYEDTTADEERTIRKKISEHWIDLSLIGPNSVIAAGSEVRDRCFSVVRQMTRTREFGYEVADSDQQDEGEPIAVYENAMGILDELAYALFDEVKQFAEVASAALDDDGTELPGLTVRRR
ncbi:hypothetical protein [Streptomyces sp. H39-S7]|uniref:hypothetical protein n=1 Tax=Streptomyces sp. H39-S7 TaxID=3004357 RepID=UPI0022AF92D4|nr:hypothetical protein [Streptomyces sp. H39-S7]MCZ4117829.1 hypothetical protein [Streptomyces sp. H39-S7]